MCNGAAKQVSAGVAPCNIKVETRSGTLKLVSKFALAGFCFAYAANYNKTERDQFHEVMSHGETLVFITTAIAATVAEIESGSTFLKLVSQRKLKFFSRNRSCYTVQCLLKLVPQRRCSQVLAKSFNV